MEPLQPVHGRQCYQLEDDRMRSLSGEVIMDKAKGAEAKSPPRGLTGAEFATLTLTGKLQGLHGSFGHTSRFF